MSKPLVSIIIPTYNRAHLIGETLDSVLAQTYTNWECIVVDDGSTDTTDEVLKLYCDKDERFQFYNRPKDRSKGANACRNYGFELSKGEYINWFDSDDLMTPEKLTLQINELHSSSFDYSICQTMMFDVQNNKEIGLRAPKIKSNNIFDDYIAFKIFWLTGAPIWKRSFLTKNNLYFDEQLYQAQDFDFHYRVLAISTNYFPYEKPLVIFKKHNENMSNSATNTEEKLNSNIKVRLNILKNYKSKLSSQTKFKLYEDLLNIYKFTIKNKNFYISFKLLVDLIVQLNFINFKFYTRVKIFINLITSYLSFFLFNKGERFLKFNF